MTKLSSNAIFCFFLISRLLLLVLLHSFRVLSELSFVETFRINEINSLNSRLWPLSGSAATFKGKFFSADLDDGQKGSSDVIEIRSSCVWYGVQWMEARRQQTAECERGERKTETATDPEKNPFKTFGIMFCAFRLLSVPYKQLQWDRWKSGDIANVCYVWLGNALCFKTYQQKICDVSRLPSCRFIYLLTSPL